VEEELCTWSQIGGKRPIAAFPTFEEELPVDAKNIRFTRRYNELLECIANHERTDAVWASGILEASFLRKFTIRQLDPSAWMLSAQIVAIMRSPRRMVRQWKEYAPHSHLS
tara:strand:- start:12 stop:344 length:333 start_codon:yes stop_codon:yes gene_type:complete